MNRNKWWVIVFVFCAIPALQAEHILKQGVVETLGNRLDEETFMACGAKVFKIGKNDVIKPTSDRCEQPTKPIIKGWNLDKDTCTIEFENPQKKKVELEIKMPTDKQARAKIASLPRGSAISLTEFEKLAFPQVNSIQNQGASSPRTLQPQVEPKEGL